MSIFWERRNDDLDAARGIINALIFSAVMWAIGFVIWGAL